MTEAEFRRFQTLGIEEYAQERARNFDTPIDEERAEATRRYAQLLPDGLHTPNHRLWTVIDDADAPVGLLWVHADPPRHRAYIYWIRIEAQRRGQGYGKRALALLEDELRPLGIDRISLNVFADNTVAQALYRRQGYQVTNLNMTRHV